MGLLDNLKPKEEQPVTPAEAVVEPVEPTAQVEEAPVTKTSIVCGNCQGVGLLGEPTGKNEVCSQCLGTGVKS